jgi:hypothetical protein
MVWKCSLVVGTQEIHALFLWGNVAARGYFKVGKHGRIMLKWIFQI